MKSLIIRILAAFFIISLLAGCSLVKPAKLDMQQGNIVNKEKISKLQPGMSKQQVLSILGDPVLINTFNDNRLDYVYTFQPGYGNRKEQRLTVYFKNNRLERFTSDLSPNFSKATT